MIYCVIDAGVDDSLNESEIINWSLSLSIFHKGTYDSINEWIWNCHQAYIIINHSHRSRWFYQWIWIHQQVYIIIHHSRRIIENDIHLVYIIIYHSHWSRWFYNESEIITKCISLSIIHTGANDSINEYEIITRWID